MRNSSVARLAIASVIVVISSGAAHAQSEPQKISKTAKTQSQKPAPKTTHKVWTEDDMSTVRTQADKVIDASDRQQQVANDAAVAHEASDKQPAKDAPKPPAKKPPLSQAKSAEDADAKIGWEKRDIQGQEEYIASLEERLASATPEERAHLQQLIELHKQYIVDSRKEMQGLEEQKKEFQNPKRSPAPAAEPATSAEAQPPSQ
jgi:hypothetical protein